MKALILLIGCLSLYSAQAYAVSGAGMADTAAIVHNDSAARGDTAHIAEVTHRRADSLCTIPMSNTAYQAARASINTTSYDETKLKGARAIAGNNCLSAKQIAMICMLFDFEETKLIFARFAYPHCYDKRNYSKVADVLISDPDKAVLNMLVMKEYPIPVTIYKAHE